MLIRHDLELVFIHVPKCAGKQLRSVLAETAPQGCLRELWNYGYSKILHRYVDLAHLPLQDLRAFPEFSYLDHYRVLACTRNPYARLPSAVHEFYRQRSREDERTIIEGRLTAAMKEDYYQQLAARHAELDPRFIHSLPMHYFTHDGDSPKVDFLLRTEHLRSDFLLLAERFDWPALLRDRAAETLRDEAEPLPAAELTPRELALAHQLYAIDFRTFDYPMMTLQDAELEVEPRDSASIRFLHRAPAVDWHWGPQAANTFPAALRPCRR